MNLVTQRIGTPNLYLYRNKSCGVSVRQKGNQRDQKQAHGETGPDKKSGSVIVAKQTKNRRKGS